jgi:hypothetical protein
MWRAVSRDLFTDPIFRGNDEIVAWCLMFARYARVFDDDASGLKRGQFKASRAELARRFQKSVDRDPARTDPKRWTLAKTRSFLARMEKHGALKSEKSTDEHGRAVTLFTVMKFDKWQSKGQQAESQAERKPSASRIASSNADGSGQIETRAASQIASPAQAERKPNSRHRETVFLETEILETKTLIAPGPWATGPQPASTEPLVEPPPAKDEKKPKPSVKPIGDWPGIDVDQKWKGYKFPEEFNAIWAPWLLTQKRNSNVKAIGKQNSYRLILNWLHDGLTPADVLRATKDYMREFWNDPNKTHCVHPATFYSRANPTLPDRIAAFAGTTGPAPIRDRWHNPRDAWRECVSLANHLGVELPDVPKRAYGAEWEDVEAFHPLVIQYATDRTGFKTMPDDLAGRIQGAQ